MDEIERIRDYYSPTPGVSEGITIQHVRTLLAALDAEKARVKELEGILQSRALIEPYKQRAEQAERERDKLRDELNLFRGRVCKVLAEMRSYGEEDWADRLADELRITEEP